jgi:hypothetical protein
MDVSCSAEPCPVILNATCVFYEGENLIYTGINTNDSLQTALQKIDAKFGDVGLGYIFQNGIIQSAPGQPEAKSFRVQYADLDTTAFADLAAAVLASAEEA